MMKYNEWKLITESMAGTVALGLSRPQTIGGPIGSHFSDKPLDKDELEPEDEMDDEEEEDFPFEDEEEMEDQGLGDDGNDDDDDEEDFLKDIDPALLGDEEDDLDAAEADDELGDEEGEEDDLDAAEADDELGDEEGEESLDHEKDHNDLLAMMANYCTKYMKAESVDHKEEKVEMEDDKKPAKKKCGKWMKKCGKWMKVEADTYEECGMGDSAEEMLMPVRDEMANKGKKSCGKMMKKTCGKMMKKHMAKDDGVKHCNCESTDFLTSLKSQLKGNNLKNSSGITEDALLSPEYDEPKAGEVGFAPAGKVNAIGGGYTADDFADIPVLGQ